MMTEDKKQERIQHFREKIAFLERCELTHVPVYDAYTIAIAALTQPASPAFKLPDGWVAVPAELTLSMQHAWDGAPNCNGEDEDVNMQNAYRAMIAAAPAMIGWKIVPIEATPEMLDASWELHSIFHPSAYRTMINAAPTAPHTAQIEPICATGGAEWVKCSERVPLALSDDHISDVEVIVTDGATVGTCEYRRGFMPSPWAEWSNYGDIDADKITHWMPLPSAPTDSTN